MFYKAAIDKCRKRDWKRKRKRLDFNFRFYEIKFSFFYDMQILVYIDNLIPRRVRRN